MEKSNHRYGSNIPYRELSNFIEPINISIPIDINYVDNFTSFKDSFKQIIDNEYINILNNIPTLKVIVGARIDKLESITYTPHTTGYDFRINPVDVFNSIFKYLRLNYEIPFINLDNPDGMNYLKDYVRSYVKDICRITDNSTIISIMNEINSNLDNICKVYDNVLDDDIKGFIIPKDALFYISYRSLELFENTSDPRYMILPYEYYHYVSHMNTSPFPHAIFLPNKYHKCWFNNFRTDYEEKIGIDYKADASKFLLTNSEVYLAWDILSPGMVEREIKDVIQRVRSNPNVDYQKYQKLFEMKMNFYMNSGYVKYIMGKYGLSGYVGFTYPNEYLVFDKFHNSQTKNPSRKTILTHGEAVYALPSDKFSILKGDKQLVLQERALDDRIKKINHNETFINRLEPVVHGPNVSTSTFDEEVVKSKILIKK